MILGNWIFLKRKKKIEPLPHSLQKKCFIETVGINMKEENKNFLKNNMKEYLYSHVGNSFQNIKNTDHGGKI